MKNYIFVKPLLLSFVTLLLLISGCDSSSITPASNSDEETRSELSGRFFANADSLNTLLDTAVDTLKQRNIQNGFVHEFITKRGYPIWDAHSAFYKKGKPVFRVPVQAANGQKITGFIEVMMEESQPTYYWIARGTQLKGISPEGLQTLMWGYEKRVFGKTHTDEGARIIQKTADPKEGDAIQYMGEEVCWSTCAGSFCGEWECEGGGDSGGGDSGGFGGERGEPSGGGGGGTGGSPDYGDDEGSGDDDCANYKARMPVAGCEDNEEDDGGSSAPSLNNDLINSIDPECGKPFSEQDPGIRFKDYKIWCDSKVPSGTKLDRILSALNRIDS